MAVEPARHGFWWLDPDDHDGIRTATTSPNLDGLNRNQDLVRQQFSLDVITGRVKELIDGAGLVHD